MNNTCDWCGLPGADTTVPHDGHDYRMHGSTCAWVARRAAARAAKGRPALVPWSAVPPQRASGYVPTGGRGARAVDAALSSGRPVPETVPTADVIDGVARRRR